MSQTWTDDVFAGTHVAQTDLQNIENNFACLKSIFSGPSAPSNPVAYMLWADTTNGILKMRNAANSAWLSIWDITGNKPYGQDFTDGAYLDGDQIDIDYTPANYTPDASPAEAADVDDLTAHLKGIDTKVGEGVVDGSITQAKLAAFATGSSIIAAADTEQSLSNSTTPTKKKEIQVSRSGTLNIAFDLRRTSIASGEARGRIYVNGAAVGTQRATASSSYVTFTEDISVSVGDLVQLYIWQEVSHADAIYCRNFRLRHSELIRERVVLD